MAEFWENIPDFPGYQVSDWGRVANDKTGRIMKQTDNGSGNLIVCLQGPLKQQVRQVRWLVAEVYLEPSGYFDRVPQHINRDYTDNRAENLFWMSKSDIYWRSYQERHGLSPDEKPVRDLETGLVYDNIFLCAAAIDGYARHIDKSMRNSEFSYKGKKFQYV